MSAPLKLSGKTALVTGVNGLLGSIWSDALLGAGARVVGLDLKLDSPSDSLQALLSSHQEGLILREADVCSRDSLERLAGEFEVDVLVNNAGIDQPPRPGKGYRVEDFPYEEFSKVVEVNLCGAFQCAQVFGEGMTQRRSGSIINIGSLYGTVSPDASLYTHMPMDPPFIKPPAYAASKAGLLHITRYLAAHWGPYNVRVNALSPGGVLGAQDEEFQRKFNARVPLCRMAESQDLKGPMLFLASDDSAYVTGQNIQVDGGFTCW